MITDTGTAADPAAAVWSHAYHTHGIYTTEGFTFVYLQYITPNAYHLFSVFVYTSFCPRDKWPPTGGVLLVGTPLQKQ